MCVTPFLMTCLCNCCNMFETNSHLTSMSIGKDVCLIMTMVEKDKFTLFSDHNGSLPGRQPGAMTISHSPKGKETS